MPENLNSENQNVSNAIQLLKYMMENLSPEERTLIVSALQNSNDVHNETNVRDNNAPQMVEERRGLRAYNLRNPTVLPVIYINAETDDIKVSNNKITSFQKT